MRYSMNKVCDRNVQIKVFKFIFIFWLSLSKIVVTDTNICLEEKPGKVGELPVKWGPGAGASYSGSSIQFNLMVSLW